MRILLIGEGPSELAGALESLVRRLGHVDAIIDRDRVSNPDLHSHHGKGKGYFKRSIRWMLEAKKRGYDALVLLIDQDGVQERARELTEAQESTVTSIRRALGVAIETFDAWMLADESALTRVLGVDVSRQRNPEAIADPKAICSDLLSNSPQSYSPVELYKLIADELDLDLLQTRCEKGFTVFAERVRSLNL